MDNREDSWGTWNLNIAVRGWGRILRQGPSSLVRWAMGSTIPHGSPGLLFMVHGPQSPVHPTVCSRPYRAARNLLPAPRYTLAAMQLSAPPPMFWTQDAHRLCEGVERCVLPSWLSTPSARRHEAHPWRRRARAGNGSFAPLSTPATPDSCPPTPTAGLAPVGVLHARRDTRHDISQ